MAHTFEATHGETSDDARMRSILLRSLKNRFDLSYPYDAEDSQQFTYGAQAVIDHREVSGQSVNGQSFSLLGGRKLTPNLALEARVGVHRQVVLAKQATSVGEGSAVLSATPFTLGAHKIFAQASAETGSAYSQLSIPIRNEQALRATTARGLLAIHPIERVRVVSRATWSVFSDRNFRNQYGADALYGFATYPLWIWVGVGAERMHNSTVSGNYWTPEVFTQWGLRGEMSIPFNACTPETFWGARVLRPLAFTFGGSLGRIKEAGFAVGSSNYSMTSLQWGGRGDSNLRMSYERIRSEQNGSEWRSDAWILAGQLVF